MPRDMEKKKEENLRLNYEKENSSYIGGDLLRRDPTILPTGPQTKRHPLRPEPASCRMDSRTANTDEREKSKTLELLSFHSCQDARRTRESKPLRRCSGRQALEEGHQI